MSFNLLVVGGWDTDWCTSSHGKTRFHLRGKIPQFKFWNSVQAVGRNLGTERSDILKFAEVVSTVPVLSFSTSGSPEETNMSMNDSPDSYQPRPSLSLLTSPILYFPPSLQLHQYRIIGILHKTQDAGRKYILISKFLFFLFLHFSTNPLREKRW